MLRHPSRSQYLRSCFAGISAAHQAFAEFNNASAYPAMFLLWKEDREILLSLKKSLEQVTKNNRRTKSVNFHNSDNAGTLYNVQQNFSFRD
jgi:hypothetical protein